MTIAKHAQDHAEIETLFARLGKAHAQKDAAAIAASYAADAVVFDMAPPLARRGFSAAQIAEWLDTWDTAIEVDVEDEELTVGETIAFSTALNRMRGRQGGEDQDLWFRTTMCLAKSDDGWRIVHEHSSVPFHMDGSYRAATDLKPS